MPFHDYPCFICAGKMQLEIGRNIDDHKERIVLCPMCNGKGVLHVSWEYYSSDYNKMWKRMLGDPHDKDNK